MSVDLDTRRLRYFVAVCDELHFGRAAARFYIAPQAMSRQIKLLEERIGVELFERTTRHVRLTVAGQRFLDATSTILETLEDGIEAARVAHSTDTATLTVGFRPGMMLELTTPILQAFGDRYPEVTLQLRELDVRQSDWSSDGGGVDVAIIRTPFDHARRRFEPLVSEPRSLAVARDHPLAGKRVLRLAEIPQLPVAVAMSTNPLWERYWSLSDELGAASRPIVRVNSAIEELELVAAGRVVSVTTASAARYLAHPAVRYVPIVDLRPCTLGLAWDPALEGAYLRGFVAIALQVRDSERELVAFIEDPLGRRST